MAKLAFTKSGRAFRSPKDKQGVGAWDADDHLRHQLALERKDLKTMCAPKAPKRRGRDGIDRKNKRGEV